MIDTANIGTIGVEPPRSVERIAKDKPETRSENPAATKRAEAEAEKANRTEPVVDREAVAETIARALYDDFPSGASLDIEVNDDADVVIYKAIDPDTGEVLKQFRPEEVVDRLERLSKAKGLAVDSSV